MRARSSVPMVALAVLLDGCSGSCAKKSDGVAEAGAPKIVVAPSASAGAPRPGMAWIPAGILKAGSLPSRAPRVAEEEMPGVDVELRGFYIDLMAYPNEPGAIPTSNVTRDEAEKLCASKAKRLCSELEWERACKGPENRDYEYGDAYRAATCGTGLSIEQAAKRPMGERSACKSGFGVLEMHGGAWEWTSSSWGRGAKEPELGVLRGGNSEAGELVGRCANALARPASSKGPTMGFRCCAGDTNAARVELSVQTGPALSQAPAAADDRLGAAGESVLDASAKTGGACRVERHWVWRPVANEKLLAGSVCTAKGPPHCALVVVREDGPLTPVARFDAGRAPPELDLLGEGKKLRARGLDAQGSFSREVTYAYGRVEVGEAKRP